MKNLTNVIFIGGCLIAAYILYYLVLGDAGNFNDVEKMDPKNSLGTIYTGGFLVGLLLACILVAITYTIERLLTIGRAGGSGDMKEFGRTVVENVKSGNYSAALAACDEQRGSLANVLHAAVTRFAAIENDPSMNGDQKIAETQRVIDENMNLETPLLEKNLPILSTVASVSTMIGLLGTTIGMIRSFQALGASGTVSAQALSIGISEALYNTAGGLIAAILSIVAYNFFTSKVDDFTYRMDETLLDIMQTLAVKTGSKT
ncbi:MAG: MotA/TolQ/ExbB proton channel family protein [Ignavibacteria bacterium]|nr:MotA/TolQ/ExbB proton channel family protein [Ignavibacteria bacterium]